MKRYFILVNIILFNTSVLFCQEKKEIIRNDTLYVYKNYTEKIYKFDIEYASLKRIDIDSFNFLDVNFIKKSELKLASKSLGCLCHRVRLDELLVRFDKNNTSKHILAALVMPTNCLDTLSNEKTNYTFAKYTEVYTMGYHNDIKNKLKILFIVEQSTLPDSFGNIDNPSLEMFVIKDGILKSSVVMAYDFQGSIKYSEYLGRLTFKIYKESHPYDVVILDENGNEIEYPTQYSIFKINSEGYMERVIGGEG